MLKSLAHSSASVLTPVAMLAACGLLSACINQSGSSNPYRAFAITEQQLKKANQHGYPYVKNRRGHLQTIRPVDFETEQFGLVRILPKYVSDGSSRPFDRDHGSNMAALLHDALYRGAPQLTFPDGYPGRWTRQQANAAYCLQLRHQNATAKKQTVNCRALKLFGSGAWNYHTKEREAYWQNQEKILTKKRLNSLSVSPG